MNRYERMLYWLYKKNHEVKLSKRRYGVGKATKREMTRNHATKANEMWELRELYYDGLTDP